jgi:hypothetical protein
MGIFAQVYTPTGNGSYNHTLRFYCRYEEEIFGKEEQSSVTKSSELRHPEVKDASAVHLVEEQEETKEAAGTAKNRLTCFWYFLFWNFQPENGSLTTSFMLTF